MPNSWNIKFILPTLIGMADVWTLVRTISCVGDEPCSAIVTGLVFSDGDNGPPELSWQDATTAVIEREGCFTVWKGPLDFSVGVDRKYNSLSVSVLHELRKERSDDVAKARLLRVLFREACRALHPLHGFCHDEWSFEAATQGYKIGALEGLMTAACKREPPPALCWLNFFCVEYYACPVRGKLEGIGVLVDLTDIGAFVSLGEWPWDSRVMLL